MEEIEIEIKDDKKEKYQSWSLQIGTFVQEFDSDDNHSCLGGGFVLSKNVEISMYDNSFENLKVNSFKELERLKEKGYISDNLIKKVEKKFNEYGN